MGELGKRKKTRQEAIRKRCGRNTRARSKGRQEKYDSKSMRETKKEKKILLLFLAENKKTAQEFLTQKTLTFSIYLSLYSSQ